MGIFFGGRVPEAERQIDAVLLQERYAFVLKSARHDLRVPEGPATAEPALTIHDAMAGELRALWYAV